MDFLRFLVVIFGFFGFLGKMFALPAGCVYTPASLKYSPVLRGSVRK